MLRKEKQTFTDEDIEKIFAAVKKLRMWFWERDYLAIWLMLRLGLRVEECVTIQEKDIDWEKRILHIKATKVGEIQPIALKENHVEVLRIYIKTFRHKFRDGYIFFPYKNTGYKGRRPLHLHQNTLRHRFYMYLKEAGLWEVVTKYNYKDGRIKNIQRFWMHDLRRTFATKLRRNNPNAPLDKLAQATRHKNLDNLKNIYIVNDRIKEQEELAY